ncbi:hypothetical protein [Streptomyces sp. NPDC101237]|uniref:hypothetical protein n=1 Tax=Streptomyces sp. NPDC101237 TaxID=3366139 RepID=UPI0037F9367C
MGRESESGLPVEPVHGPSAPADRNPAEQLGEPGAYPFTRGAGIPEGRDRTQRLPPMRTALRARATVGEVCDAPREVWGVYVPADVC